MRSVDIVLISLCFLTCPFVSKAAGILILSNNSPTNSISCGNSYAISVPNYSGNVWLSIVKNGILIISKSYTLPIQPFPSVCNYDEGNYDITISKPIPDNGNGDLIGKTILTINGQTIGPPRLFFKNITNSSRALQVYTEDYVRFEVKSKNYGVPVQLCKLHQQNTVCSFVSSYTNRDTGEWQSTQQILPLTDLGDWEIWVNINNQESNHVFYTILPKPKDPSYLVTCFLVQERPHPDVWPTDKVTWTILSRPIGYKTFWYETTNSRLDLAGLPTGYSTNIQFPETFTSTSERVYERWAQLRNKKGEFVCNTNAINFVVAKQQPASSPLSQNSNLNYNLKNINSLFGLLLHFLKFDKIK